jgi:FkbM family methyltransferase
VHAPGNLTSTLLDRLGDRLVAVADVGARDGVHDRWRAFAPGLRILAFEPDVDEATRLEQSAPAGLEVVPIALAGSSGTRTLHLTRSPGASSLLRPNRAFLDRFPDARRFDVMSSVEVPTSTLDEVLAERGAGLDFLKLDVQGAVGEILDGAQTCLQSLLGLELELELAPMYEGETLFGEIDERLRGADYDLVDLRPTYWRRREVADAAGTKGQVIFADALYLLSPDVLAERAPDDGTLTAAMVIAAAYGCREWILSYAAIEPERFKDIAALARSGRLASAPEFRLRHILGLFAKDLGDALLTERSRWAFAEQGFGGAPRFRRLPRLR